MMKKGDRADRLRRASVTRKAMLLASSMLAGTAPAFAVDVAGVEEIVVTAQKRSENIQDVPISIQALSTQRLDQLNVSDLYDYINYLPSVSFQSYAPGSTTIYMRGVASGENNNHSGPLPSVGVYLDEQPVTTIGGTLDVHIYDIARVEALAGPQGTLFGASSQAGTLRIITNAPNTAEFEAGYDLEINTVEHGDQGYVAEGFVNVPLSDKAAIRLVGWYQHDAGYIDNVPATQTYIFQNGPDITINNDALVEKNYNDVDTYGGRAALKIDLNDNWTVTPAVMAQDQKRHGSFAYDSTVGDLQVESFKPESGHDRWIQAALTIEGKVGNLDLVYAGAYMKRKINSRYDYADYSAYYNAYDYNYVFPTYGVNYYAAYDDNGDFIDQTQYIVGIDTFTKQSHEFRLQSDKANRLRFVAGLFYQRQTHDIEQRYAIDGLGDAQSVTGQEDIWWLTKQYRIDKDYAAFGEVSFDFTEKLTGTAGMRYFKYDNSLVGFFGFNYWEPINGAKNHCFAAAPDPTERPCTNLDKSTKGDDFTYKFNLTYRVDDDVMLYATTSKGFRPGGINRRGGLPPYRPDWVTSYEVGWKTNLADNRVRFNGAIYWLDWKDMQFSYLGQNSLTEIKNAGKARVKGIEADLIWVADEHLTLTAAAAYTDAKLKVDYCKYENPQFDCTIPGPDDAENSLQAPKGAQLPITAKFKMNATARYEFMVSSLNSYVQGSYVYNGSSWPGLRTSDNELLGKQRAYSLVDFSAGVSRDSWSLQFFLQNAFDKRADQFRYSQCGGCTNVFIGTNQPRTLALKFGQKF